MGGICGLGRSRGGAWGRSGRPRRGLRRSGRGLGRSGRGLGAVGAGPGGGCFQAEVRRSQLGLLGSLAASKPDPLPCARSLARRLSREGPSGGPSGQRPRGRRPRRCLPGAVLAR